MTAEKRFTVELTIAHQCRETTGLARQKTLKAGGQNHRNIHQISACVGRIVCCVPYHPATISRR
jgi:hypothetical protein